MTEDEKMNSYISNKNSTWKNYALKPEYFYARVSKACGVPKVTVTKVIRAMGDVIYEEIARCGKVTPFHGVVFEGIWKKDKGRGYHDLYSGTVKESKTLIRSKCNFTPYAKKRIHEFYYKHKEEEEKNAKSK